MSKLCKWLHEQLEELPLIKFPFKLEELPENGLYFFYEQGEIWGHGGNKPRIVRIGTHRDGNFRNRIAEHYLLDETKTNFSKDNPKPSDRSIFRKNIGRALLNERRVRKAQYWSPGKMVLSQCQEQIRTRSFQALRGAICNVLSPT